MKTEITTSIDNNEITTVVLICTNDVNEYNLLRAVYSKMNKENKNEDIEYNDDYDYSDDYQYCIRIFTDNTIILED